MPVYSNAHQTCNDHSPFQDEPFILRVPRAETLIFVHVRKNGRERPLDGANQHRLEASGVWTVVGGQVRELAPTGLEGSAQGFNPGNVRPERRALKMRQIERASNVEVRSNCGTIQKFPRVETLG
jgi:hypothetical protein